MSGQSASVSICAIAHKLGSCSVAGTLVSSGGSDASTLYPPSGTHVEPMQAAEVPEPAADICVASSPTCRAPWKPCAAQST